MIGADLAVFPRLVRTRTLLTLAACFGIGVILAYYVSVPYKYTLFAALALLLIYAGIKLMGGVSVMALVLAAMFMLGAARMSYSIAQRPEVTTKYNVKLTGVIDDMPYVDPDMSRLMVKLTDVSVYERKLDYDIRLYLRGDLHSLNDIEFGQAISTRAHFWAGGVIDGEFDFGEYLWRNGMGAYATAYLDKTELTPAEPSFRGYIYSARKALGVRIDELFPDSSELVRALLIGDRNALSDEVTEDFRSSGISHILAISGLHVSLMAFMISFLLRRLMPRNIAYIVTILFLVFYAILVGLRASVLRAVIMYVLYCLCKLCGRPDDPITRLSFAFWALLVYNPFYIKDAGFVLSFAATAGLICVSSSVAAVFRWEIAPGHYRISFGGKFTRSLKGAVVTTLTAQLCTLPAIASYYGELPVFCTLANVLIVPLVLLSIPLSAAFVLLSYALPSVAAVLAHIPDMLLTLVTGLSGYIAELPFSLVAINGFPAPLSVLFFLACFACSDLTRLKLNTKRFLVISLPFIAAISYFVT